MKLNIKWSSLTNEQRNQVKSFHAEVLEKRELFEHDLNKREYLVNPKNGNVVQRKDF